MSPKRAKTQEKRGKTPKNLRKSRKTCGKLAFHLDFAHPQAALFSTTGFSGPAWIKGFDYKLPPLDSLRCADHPAVTAATIGCPKGTPRRRTTEWQLD
jgi:hypothetical protein